MARHTAYNFLSIALSSVVGIGVTALVARVLAPDLMGVYTLLLWIVTVAGLLANLGYVTATMKHMAEALGRDDPASAAGYLSFSLRRMLLFGLAVMFALLATAPWVAPRLGHGEIAPFMAVGVLGIMPGALVSLFTSASQALQRYDHVALVTGLMAAVSLGGTVGVLWAHAGIIGLFAVSAAGFGVGVLAYWILLSRWRSDWWHAPLSPEQQREIRSYQGPVFVMLVLDTIVWQRSEVFFLGAYSPSREVAYYGMAFGLANMAMKLIPGTLVGLLIPNMARSMGAGDREGVARAFTNSCRYMAMLAVPVAVGGAILALPLVRFLYGHGYEPVAGLLVALLAANSLVMIYGFPASSVMYSTNAQHLLVRIGLAISALNLLLAWVLIPRYGAWGAVASNCLAQLASLWPGMAIARARTGTGAPVKVVFEMLVAAMAMAVPVWAIAHLFPSWLALLLAPPIGGVVFGLTLAASGRLSTEDRALLGALGQRLARPFVKVRLAPTGE
jgi:stage V sporulation protein B